MNKAIGFIGLGVMGFPMAGHLTNHYKNIAVFNRTKKNLKSGIRNLVELFASHQEKLQEYLMS